MLKIIPFVFLLSCALAGTTRNSRIPAGAVTTTIDKYPYQISLQYAGTHICGGTILSENWVITAATCMPYPLSGYSVRVGTSTRNSGGTVFDVSTMIRHPEYSSRTYDYDIAVLRISGAFTFDTNVQPVVLTSEEPSGGEIGVATGYGITTGSTSDKLELVTLPIVTREQCISSYGDEITDRMICAGYMAGGRDVCQGGTGTPLAVDGKQVGIVSWGYGCARPNYPGVYTNVAILRTWIFETTGVV